jgi:hypothetical protein
MAALPSYANLSGVSWSHCMYLHVHVVTLLLAQSSGIEPVQLMLRPLQLSADTGSDLADGWWGGGAV